MEVTESDRKHNRFAYIIITFSVSFSNIMYIFLSCADFMKKASIEGTCRK